VYRDKAKARLKERKEELKLKSLEEGQEPRRFEYEVEVRDWKSGDVERGLAGAPTQKSMYAHLHTCKPSSIC
jgi:hypothetical protein